MCILRSKFHKLNEQMTMTWTFPLLARQVIRAADPPVKREKELLPGKQAHCTIVTNDVRKKGAAFDVVEMSENTKVPTASLKKLFVQLHTVTTCSTSGSQGGFFNASTGLMTPVLECDPRIVDSCLRVKCARFIGWNLWILSQALCLL